MLDILNNFKNIYLYCGVLLYKKDYRYNNCQQYYNNNKTDILISDFLLLEVINILKLEDIKKKSNIFNL